MASEQWNCTAEEYHAAHQYIGHSMLECFRQCPPLYKRRYIDGTAQRDETPSLRIGTLLHRVALEDVAIVAEPSCDKRTKIGKALYAAFVERNEGRWVVTQEEYDAIHGMVAGLYDNPAGEAILERALATGVVEQSFRWLDESGLWLKCRFDALLPDGTAVSLKTSNDPSPEGFQRAIHKYGYHRQEAHYLSSGEATKQVFVVVRNSEPYDSYVYELHPVALDIGREQNRAALSRLKACYEFDNWEPEGFGKVLQITLPDWALREELCQTI